VKLSLCLTKHYAMKIISCLINHHAIKIYWGNESIGPHILNLCTRWRWGVRFSPRLLHP